MNSLNGLPDSQLPIRFSVLLQVHRPPTMLPYAIETVLAQSVKEFELFVIGDGAPDETIACARAYAIRDRRVKVCSFAKGAYTGGSHRHVILSQSNNPYVAHMGDDDLWFPNHLEEMEKLLSKVDFGHTINVHVACDESLETLASDLGNAEVRRRQVTAVSSLFAEAVTGYRIEAYRRLREGWTEGGRPTPPDLYMWRKFLQQDDIRCGTRMAITALIFPTEFRKHMSLEERGRENRLWQVRLLDPTQREEIVQEAWRSLMCDFLNKEEDRKARLRVIETMTAQFNAIERTTYNRLPPNGHIDFTEEGNSFLYTVSGWSFPEVGFRWTSGKESSMRVQLRSLSKPVMRLHASAFDGFQRVVVVVDGKPTAELTVDAESRDHDVDIQTPAAKAGADNEILFRLPDAHSPASIGISPDQRELGLAVKSITFLPIE